MGTLAEGNQRDKTPQFCFVIIIYLANILIFLFQSNVTLVGEFCRDEVPRLCDHALLSNATRFTRPCSLAESYVSSGPELTVEQALAQGTALYPVTFTLRYEFVDTSLEVRTQQTFTNLYIDKRYNLNIVIIFLVF